MNTMSNKIYRWEYSVFYIDGDGLMAAAMNIGQILVAKHIISPSQLEEALERKKAEPTKYLGQIFCEMGVPQSKIIKALYYSNKRKKIGQILVELQLVTDEQLNKVLEEQRRLQMNGVRKQVGALLISRRILDEDSYVNALSAHFNMPVVSLKGHLVSEMLQCADWM